MLKPSPCPSKPGPSLLTRTQSTSGPSGPPGSHDPDKGVHHQGTTTTLLSHPLHTDVHHQVLVLGTVLVLIGSSSTTTTFVPLYLCSHVYQQVLLLCASCLVPTNWYQQYHNVHMSIGGYQLSPPTVTRPLCYHLLSTDYLINTLHLPGT